MVGLWLLGRQWLPGRTVCASCLHHCLVDGWIVSGWVDACVTGQVNMSEFLGEWFDSCWFWGNGVHLVSLVLSFLCACVYMCVCVCAVSYTHLTLPTRR